MSSETEGDGDDGRHPSEITLSQSDDGDWWVATDEETGVGSQGQTREEALEMLDEAVALHRGEIGDCIESPEEEREVLRELGIDPDEVAAARSEADDLPGFMQ